MMLRYFSLCLFALVAASASAGSVRGGVGGVFNSNKLIKAKKNGIKDQYIIVFKDDTDIKDIDKESDDLVKSFGGQKKGKAFRIVLRGFAARMSEAAAMAISKREDVAFVEQDAEVHTNQAPESWGLDRIDQHNLPLSKSSYAPSGDGSGVHVYIIDTGIRASHNEFAGRVGTGYDFVDNDSVPQDCNGHGTHVAGTVVGTTYGVAKKATVHGVRVLNCNGSGTYSGVIAGVDWVASNHIKPAVANMSLGGGASQAVDDAVNNAVAVGVTFAIAAGNDYADDACDYSPARAADAITVGSTTSADSRSSFSNIGTCVDIFAPGSGITSAWYNSDSASNTISGTSMASPHIAGIAALILGPEPNLTPSQVTSKMTSEATSGVISNVGAGSPNLLACVESGAGSPAAGCSAEVLVCGSEPACCTETHTCEEVTRNICTGKGWWRECNSSTEKSCVLIGQDPPAESNCSEYSKNKQCVNNGCTWSEGRCK